MSQLTTLFESINYEKYYFIINIFAILKIT